MSNVFENSLTLQQYAEIMALPMWSIWNDPDNHDCENKNYDHYYVENIYAKTPDGIIVLPARRVVNGASIPWIIQPLIPKSGKYNRPAGFHDIGFEDGGYWTITKNIYGDLVCRFIRYNQKKVDYTYLKLMEGRGVAKWNRNTQYRGLRMGGWYTWNKYRKKEQKKSKKEVTK